MTGRRLRCLCCLWVTPDPRESVACCGSRFTLRNCCLCAVPLSLVSLGMLAFLISFLVSVQPPPPGPPTPHYPRGALDVRVGWFGPGNVRDDALFNPSLPTVLYVHGWEPGSAARQFRETFNYAANEPRWGVDVNTADAWLALGYNVGAFYWNQLADEDRVEAAEDKLYSGVTRYKMRWRRVNGSLADGALVPPPGSPAAEGVARLMLDALAASLRGFHGSQLRLVGHHLGAQLVAEFTLRLAAAVASGNASRALLPDRLTLLDPFATSRATSRATAAAPAVGSPLHRFIDNLRVLHAGNLSAYVGRAPLCVETYHTSDLAALYGAPLPELLAMEGLAASFSILTPTFISPLDHASKHASAPNLYFWGFSAAPPPLLLVGGSADMPPRGHVAPSARTPTAALLAGPCGGGGNTPVAAPLTHGAVQTEGGRTPDPADDVFACERFSDMPEDFSRAELVGVVSAAAAVFMAITIFQCLFVFAVVRKSVFAPIGAAAFDGTALLSPTSAPPSAAGEAGSDDEEAGGAAGSVRPRGGAPLLRSAERMPAAKSALAPLVRSPRQQSSRRARTLRFAEDASAAAAAAAAEATEDARRARGVITRRMSDTTMPSARQPLLSDGDSSS